MAEVHKEICHTEYDVHLAGDSAACRIELEQPNPKEVLKSKGFDAFFFFNKFYIFFFPFINHKITY